MDGRFFGGRKIEASLFTGGQRFKRSIGDEGGEEESEEAEKKRLDDFAQWIMKEGE